MPLFESQPLYPTVVRAREQTPSFRQEHDARLSPRQVAYTLAHFYGTPTSRRDRRRTSKISIVSPSPRRARKRACQPRDSRMAWRRRAQLNSEYGALNSTSSFGSRSYWLLQRLPANLAEFSEIRAGKQRTWLLRAPKGVYKRI